MKKLTVIIFALFTAYAVQAQENKKVESKKEETKETKSESKKESAETKAEWKELKEFHAVMASTFHPSEEGNLQPIKERSQELYDKAEALYLSQIPAEYANSDIKNNLRTLRDNAEKLNFLLKNNNITDDELKTQLGVVHDSFHKVVEKCSPEKHD